MYVLIIVITLMSGQKDIRSSICEGPDAAMICRTNAPLTVRLYREGKFQDGPPKDQIKKVMGGCFKIAEDTENRIARN